MFIILFKIIIFVRNTVHSLPVDLLVLVPPPVVGEVCVCNGDDVDEREGGRGVAKTVDIPELGGVGVDDPPPEAAALF